MKNRLFQPVFITSIIIAHFMFIDIVNCKTPPPFLQSKELEIEIDKTKYNFILHRYNPPYACPRELISNAMQQDLSTPEGVEISIWSSRNRDTDWYLSLFDEKTKTEIINSDKMYNGKILNEFKKNQPLGNPTQEGNYSIFLYKADFRYENKNCTVVKEKRLIEGTELSMEGYNVFIQEGNIWFSTDVLDEHPFVDFIASHNYEEILNLCEKGTWYTPDFKRPDPIHLTVTTDKTEYAYKEPINVTVNVRNMWEDEDIVIPADPGFEGKAVSIYVHAKEGLGMTYLLREDAAGQESDAAVSLKPNESIALTHQISESYYGEAYSEEKGSYQVPVYLEPNEYIIEATYFYKSNDQGIASGLYKSEPITIKILPDGKEPN